MATPLPSPESAGPGPRRGADGPPPPRCEQSRGVSSQSPSRGSFKRGRGGGAQSVGLLSSPGAAGGRAPDLTPLPRPSPGQPGRAQPARLDQTGPDLHAGASRGPACHAARALLTCGPSSAGSFCSCHKGVPSSGSIPVPSRNLGHMTRPGRASRATAQPRDSLGWAGAERGDAGALVRVRRDTAGAFPVTKENPFSAWSKFAKHTYYIESKFANLASTLQLCSEFCRTFSALLRKPSNKSNPVLSSGPLYRRLGMCLFLLKYSNWKVK